MIGNANITQENPFTTYSEAPTAISLVKDEPRLSSRILEASQKAFSSFSPQGCTENAAPPFLVNRMYSETPLEKVHSASYLDVSNPAVLTPPDKSSTSQSSNTPAESSEAVTEQVNTASNPTTLHALNKIEWEEVKEIFKKEAASSRLALPGD